MTAPTPAQQTPLSPEDTGYFTEENSADVVIGRMKTKDARFREVMGAVIRHLHELVKRASKPVIVAGDFNTFWGDHEIYLFMEASGLKSANRLGLPSYPSRNPRKELDFVLYSNGIEVTQFDVPDVRFSDHRPLICDFQVRRAPT